ncbi:MAG: hypothetical protein R2821_09735 [Flavobacteriaceae bacterium]
MPVEDLDYQFITDFEYFFKNSPKIAIIIRP